MGGGGKSFSSGLEGFGVSLLPEALLWGRSFPPSAPHALLPRLRGTGLTLQVSHAGEAMGSFGCSLGEGDGDGWVRGICSSPRCGPGQRCAWGGGSWLPCSIHLAAGFLCRVSAVPTPSTSRGRALDRAQPKRLNHLRAATFIHTVVPSSFVCPARSLPVEEYGLAGGPLQVRGAVAEMRFD